MKTAVLHSWLLVSSWLMMSTTTLLQNVANKECGVASPLSGRRMGRILNGTDALRGEFPWVVSIKIAGNAGGHFCGGAIIHQRIILSAAHCFSLATRRHAKTYVKIVVGEHAVKDPDLSERKLDVSEVITHINHTKRYINDIALIVLAKDLTWDKYVQPLCLPSQASDTDVDDINWTAEAVTVAGWGLTDELSNGGKFPNILQTVVLAVVPRNKCEMWFTEKVGKPVKIYDTHYCAGYYDGHADTCRGDSGGPLMLKDDVTGKHKIVGVVSSGIGCGREGMPGIYSRVARYISWILKHIAAIENIKDNLVS